MYLYSIKLNETEWESLVVEIYISIRQSPD